MVYMRLFLLTALFLLLGSAFASADFGLVFDNPNMHLEVYRGNGSYAYYAQPYNYYDDGYYFFENPFRYNYNSQYYYFDSGWYDFQDNFYNSPYNAYSHYPSYYAYYDNSFYYAPNWYANPYAYAPNYNPLDRGTTIQIVDPTGTTNTTASSGGSGFSRQNYITVDGFVNSLNGFPERVFQSADQLFNDAITPTQHLVDQLDGAESQGSWLAGSSGAFEAEPVAQPSTAPLKEFNVIISESGYSPNAFTANQGDLVRFNVLTQPGTEAHNHGISIDAYGVNESVTSSTIPTVVEVWATHAGTFTIYCKTCLGGTLGNQHPAMTATLTVRGTNAFPQTSTFEQPFPDLKPTAEQIARDSAYQQQFKANLQPAPKVVEFSANAKIELVAPETQSILGDGAILFSVKNFSNDTVTVKAHGNGLQLAQSEFVISPNTLKDNIVLVDKMSVPESFLVLEAYANGKRVDSTIVTLTSEARLEATPVQAEPTPEKPPVPQNGLVEQVEHAIATGFAFLSRNWLAGLVAVAILFVAYVAWGRKAEPQPNWPK